MRARILAALALLGAILTPAPSAQQLPGFKALFSGVEAGFNALFNGQNLEGWTKTSDFDQKQAHVSEGVLRLSEGSGWLLTQGNYYDFIVRFDARVVNDGTVGGMVVHALLVPGTEKRACYEVRLSDSEGRTGTLLWHRQNQTVLALPDGPTLKGSSGWRTYELENRGTTLAFTVDGQRLFVGTDLLHNMGRLGFSVTKGVIEFRNIRLYRVPLPDQPPLAGSVRPGGGVSVPAPLQMVKPAYAGAALYAQAQGEVWIDCVVLPDGTIGEVRVARSLRPDLDAQAMAAAKQWRFKPGTRNGEPVPVLVTLAMTFTVR